MTRYLVVDCETTGIDPETDALCEIAAVWRSDDGSVRSYSDFCNPGRPIPPQAKAVHHITEEMVADALTPLEALSAMVALSRAEEEGTFLVAHNAAFDRGFLARQMSSLAARPWICTWRCALHLWPDAPGHGNQVLRYWLGVSPELPESLHPHRALYDTLVTDAILRRMLETHSYEQLLELTTQPVLLSTCRFGKHRGQPWRQVPASYLEWVVRQLDMDADVRHTAAHWLRSQRSLL